MILVTSTLPDEGKSFVASNLALTFASQGHRTILVDCDLRKPNVEQSFRLLVNKGIVNFCANAATLDEIIIKNVHPNLDVITVGNRAKNPIQMLNSREFEVLLGELRKRYDRVLLDTPPLGAVSDALNILPLMDGAIYTIRFSGAKRGAVQRCVQRLRSANIPIFGAVMNDMKSSLNSTYYYMDTDSKAFKEYYDSNGPATSARAAG